MEMLKSSGVRGFGLDKYIAKEGQPIAEKIEAQRKWGSQSMYCQWNRVRHEDRDRDSAGNVGIAGPLKALYNNAVVGNHIQFGIKIVSGSITRVQFMSPPSTVTFSSLKSTM